MRSSQDRETRTTPLRTRPDSQPGASLALQAFMRISKPLLIYMLLLGMAIGFTVAAILGGVAGIPWGILTTTGIVAAVGVFIALLIYARFGQGGLDRIAHGVAGERAVADALQQLLPDGYEVLHDLPFDNTREDGPNIDHVAIGPGGVFPFVIPPVGA